MTKRLTRLLIAASLAAHGSFALAHGDALSHAGHDSALGQPGNPEQISRTVEITMSDSMRFSPARVSVYRNETIRFVLKNEGKLKHEMVLGTPQHLRQHAAMMLKFPDMQHTDPNQASVLPGGTAELVWQFTQAATLAFACLQPGHYEAGMKGQVVVRAATPAKTRGGDEH